MVQSVFHLKCVAVLAVNSEVTGPHFFVLIIFTSPSGLDSVLEMLHSNVHTEMFT